MPKPHARVVELDILRAFAIIIIIFSHLSYFLPNIKLSYFTLGTGVSEVNITAWFGVALFLFISGVVMYLNHPTFTQRNDWTDFFKKRVIRIFPLYWLAIALAFVLGLQYASRSNALVVLLGLQGFLSPRLGTDKGVWWFIGVILVLYATYPLIAVLASDELKLPAKLASGKFKFAIMLIVPFLILLAANRLFFIIDGQVLVFYPIFVTGVAISKWNVLSSYGLLTDDKTRLLKYVGFSAVSFTAALFIYIGVWSPINSANASAVIRFASYGFFLVLTNVLFLLFALLSFCLARIIVVSSSKASRPLSHAVWYRALLLISFSSYAIYLFFTTILIQFMHALMSTQLTALEIDIVQIFVGLPTVVLIAFVLQSTQNEIISKIRR
jgi:peptidoglycan/LPS O-acetylase OafA/YrhL